MGLLDKASNIVLNENKPAFHNKITFLEFVNKHNIKTCATFSRKNDFFYINNSIGFDGLSILSSYSTNTFWNGIIPSENKFYTFKTSDNSLLSVLQFFSFQLKENVTSVHCLRNNDSILFICKDNSNVLENEESLLNDFNNIELSSKNKITKDRFIKDKDVLVSKYSINIEESVTTFVKSKLKTHLDISDLFISAISNELMNRFELFFASPSIFKRNDEFSASLLLFFKNKLSFITLLNHLVANLSEVIENYSELIEVQDLGKIDSYLEMEEFLDVVK